MSAASAPEAGDEAAPVTAEEILRERARRLAQPAASAAAGGSGLTVLSFGLGEERYAIETKYVYSVRRTLQLTPLPLAGQHVLGLTSVQGELLVVFDLRVLFGVAGARTDDRLSLLIMGEEQPELGVAVDELGSVEELESATLFEPPIAAPLGTRPYLRGVTGTALLLIDGEALLADPRLYVDEP